MKSQFMQIIDKMVMSYSYKPVFIKSILLFSNEYGETNLNDIVFYFKFFYETRRAAGLIVEKSNSIFAKSDYLLKDAEKNILSNPYKVFSKNNMMSYDEKKRIIKVDESIWKNLTLEEMRHIDEICNSKLKDYFNKLQ